MESLYCSVCSLSMMACITIVDKCDDVDDELLLFLHFLPEISRQRISSGDVTRCVMPAKPKVRFYPRFASMVFDANLQKCWNWRRLNASAKQFRSVRMCLVKTLRLFTRLFSVINLKRYMQFLHDDDELLTMFMTDILSQKTMMHLF